MNENGLTKDLFILKKSYYETKDNKVVYRLHLWINDGILEYVVASVDKSIYDYVKENAKAKLHYELNVFNGKIYGIKNVSLA